MTRKILLAAVLAGTLLGVTVAHAQPASRPGADRERERRVLDDRDYDGIGLSDGQRGRLRAMDDEHRIVMDRLEERVRIEQRALDALRPGDAGYEAARGRVEEARRNAQRENDRHRDRRDGVLTPDQRRTVGEKRANRGDRGVGNDRRDDRREDRRDDRREDRRDKR